MSISKIAADSRRDLLRMTHRAKASHSGSSLSVVDILSVIYGGIVDLKKIKGRDLSRDIVIVSKGHAAAALYSVLTNVGLMDRLVLNSFCEDGSLIGGHVTSTNLAIELSTGSLGHGLPYGVGVALAKKRNSLEGKVIVVMSDGECDEGTTWESALIANQFKLDNLIVIIDRNKMQSLKSTEETIALEPFSEKWSSFCWHVSEIDGHDYEAINYALLLKSVSPKIIIANTTKGKGVSFMENSIKWHYKSPNSEELESALSEIPER